MQLELRDLSNDASVLIPEEGTTFGREGGGADVMLKDGGVSKRHARIFADGGAWFIEDLGSSNGTFLQTAKLQGVTELMPGDVFSMSKMKFEVVQVLGDEQSGGGATRAAPGEDFDDPVPPPEPSPKPGKRPGASQDNSGISGKPKGNTAPPPAAAKKPGAKPGASQDESRAGGKLPKEQPSKANVAPKNSPQGSAGGEDAASKGFGEVMASVPKAIAYYLVNVPLMLLNPIGTVRKGIEEQPRDPMGRIELVAWALPGQLFGAALGFIASLLYGIIRGPLSIGAILPIVPLVVAVVVSLVSGFLWHPVLKWVIDKLKGSSDERSRTNYFLAFQTATVLLPIPAAIGTLLGIVNLPILQIVPLVLGLGTTLISSYVAFRWMQHFGVMKWVPIVILVLGGLACLGTVGALFTAVRLQFSGGGAVVAAGDVVVPSGEDICASLSGDLKDNCVKAQAMAAEAKKSGEAATKQAEEASAKVAEVKPADTKKPGKKEKEKEKEPPAPKPPPEEPPAVAAADPTPPPAEQPPAMKADPPPARPTGKGYASFAAKRDAVEKRLVEDPTLLKSVSGLEELYRSYSEDVYEGESKYGKLTGKRPQDRRLNDHLRDAELYEKSEKKISELYGKLFK